MAQSFSAEHNHSPQKMRRMHKLITAYFAKNILPNVSSHSPNRVIGTWYLQK
jgi:hypothetical protein